ncbi:hypothetical protein MAR_032189 [Mya arenaria]|uniref:Uncharacterized protein n=1 Tax=Mya arenaria TaxID=6604 RepID=A0ABY7F616_MYAAR|nr:hypothetical protein MAR_032189 [Mya arenaria]
MEAFVVYFESNGDIVGGGTGDNGGAGGADGAAHVGGDCSGCGSCFDPHAICKEFGCYNICMCEPGYAFVKNGAFQCGQCLPEECSCDDGDSCPCDDGQECVNGECVPECVGCEVRMTGGECGEYMPLTY